VGENGTHDVKFLTEKKTNRGLFAALCRQLLFCPSFPNVGEREITALLRAVICPLVVGCYGHLLLVRP